jgi:hypothetical protein
MKHFQAFQYVAASCRTPTPLYSALGSALEEQYEIRADDNK